MRISRIALVLLAGLALPAGRIAAAEGAPRPSVLLVTIDTLRADRVGCYGYAAADTKNLDLLAKDGVRFDEARAHVPLTLPSHATILTGLLPPKTKVRGNGLFRLPADVPTLPETFRDAGYRTIAVVASTVLDRSTGFDRGFEVYEDNQRVGSKESFGYVERGASQIGESVEKRLTAGDGPFFLWVHFYDPHVPWVAPAAFRERHSGPHGGYDAEIAFVDAVFGRVRELATKSARGSLVVAVVSDHGESLGEHGENQHGYTLHRGVLRVPLLLAGPGIPEGTVVAPPVALVDVAPTLALAAGLPFPKGDGAPLQRFFRDEAPASSLPIWEESLHPLLDSGWAPLRGLLTSEWHFVEAPRPELYDRKRDPSDRKDLARTKSAVVTRLWKELRDAGRALGDAGDPTEESAASAADRQRREELAALGYLSGAAAAPRKGPRLDPKDGLPGFLAIEKSSELMQKGEAAAGLALVRPFVSKDPSNPRLQNQLARLLASSGDLEGAERAARKSVALDPESGFLRVTLAEILALAKNPAGALAELRAVLGKNPRDADTALAASALLVKAGDLAGAEKLLADAVAAGVRDPDVFDRLGAFHLRKGEKDEAAKLFEESLLLDPEDATALLESGRAKLRAGNYPLAIERLGRCGLGTRAFECRMELARANVMSGDLESAEAQLRAARELATDDQRRAEVDQRLAAVEQMEIERRPRP